MMTLRAPIAILIGTCIGMIIGSGGVDFAVRESRHSNTIVIDWGSICRQRCVTRAWGDVVFGMGKDIADMYT